MKRIIQIDGHFVEVTSLWWCTPILKTMQTVSDKTGLLWSAKAVQWLGAHGMRGEVISDGSQPNQISREI